MVDRDSRGRVRQSGALSDHEFLGGELIPARLSCSVRTNTRLVCPAFFGANAPLASQDQAWHVTVGLGGVNHVEGRATQRLPSQC